SVWSRRSGTRVANCATNDDDHIEGEPTPSLTRRGGAMRRLWITLSVVMLFGFAVLGWIGTRIYQEMPPIPERVVTTDGREVVGPGEIMRANTSGRRWVEWRSDRCGATADTWRATGRRSGSIARASTR